MGVVKVKTKQEIEEEKNAPKPPTAEERLESAEQAIIMLMMEG